MVAVWGSAAYTLYRKRARRVAAGKMSDEESAEYQRVLAEEKEKLEAERRAAGLERARAKALEDARKAVGLEDSQTGGKKSGKTFMGRVTEFAKAFDEWGKRQGGGYGGRMARNVQEGFGSGSGLGWTGPTRRKDRADSGDGSPRESGEPEPKKKRQRGLGERFLSVYERHEDDGD